MKLVILTVLDVLQLCICLLTKTIICYCIYPFLLFCYKLHRLNIYILRKHFCIKVIMKTIISVEIFDYLTLGALPKRDRGCKWLC